MIRLSIFFILSISFNCRVFPQNIEQTFEFANQLFSQANYQDAEYYYKRVLFFNDVGKTSDVCRKLSFCCQIRGDYSKSINYLSIASSSADDDSIKAEIIFEKSYVQLLRKQFDLALLELYNLPYTNNYDLKQKENLYLGVVYFKKNDFEKAKQYFIKSIDSLKNDDVEKLVLKFNKIKKLNRPNPELASYLNIIPGVGDLYSGSLKNSINSLLLSSGLLILNGYVSVTYTTFDSYMSVFPWFLRYYLGSMKLAKATALSKREKKKQDFYIDVLRIISDSK